MQRVSEVTGGLAELATRIAIHHVIDHGANVQPGASALVDAAV